MMHHAVTLPNVYNLLNHLSISLLIKQIRWENRFQGDTGERALITVDGTDCPIPEPHPWVDGFNQKFYSQKFHGPGAKYEVGVCVKTGDIVWYYGPFPAGMNDKQIFNIKLTKMLGPTEKVFADRGYQGDRKVIGPDQFISRAQRRAMTKARARHENINGRFKKWNALQRVFRHGRQKHHLVFKAIAAITQIEINMGIIPQQVEYEGIDPVPLM